MSLLKGYCPLAKGLVINDEIIQSLAKKYYKTPAQIAIKWSLQVKVEEKKKVLNYINFDNLKNNVPTIPSSWNLERITENFKVID